MPYRTCNRRRSVHLRDLDRATRQLLLLRSSIHQEHDTEDRDGRSRAPGKPGPLAHARRLLRSASGRGRSLGKHRQHFGHAAIAHGTGHTMIQSATTHRMLLTQQQLAQTGGVQAIVVGVLLQQTEQDRGRQRQNGERR